jgi:hypothetical protein
MKKILLPATITLLLFAFSSCKKDYTCVCTSSYATSMTPKTTTTIIHDTKGSARSRCADMGSLDIFGGTFCELK